MNFTKKELKLIYHAVRNYRNGTDPIISYSMMTACMDIMKKIESEIGLPSEPAYDSEFSDG